MTPIKQFSRFLFGRSLAIFINHPKKYFLCYFLSALRALSVLSVPARLLFAGGLVVFFPECSASRHTYYELPEAMLPHVKTEYAQLCDKGQKLYFMNCAKCHDSRVKGKEIIPDFKPEELRGYALRVSNRKHEENMPDTLVTEEELGIIMTFLSYKKKSGIPH